jgi:hypothetical protein
MEKDFTKNVKQIKIRDELSIDEDNVINITESSDMQIGTGSRIWECVSWSTSKANHEAKP